MAVEGATRRGQHYAGRAQTKLLAQPPCSHRVELCGCGGAGTMRPGRASSALAHARVGERLRDLLALLLRALVPAQRSVVVALHVALPIVIDVPEPLLGRAVAALGGLGVGLHGAVPVAAALELLPLVVAGGRQRRGLHRSRRPGSLRPALGGQDEEQPDDSRDTVLVHGASRRRWLGTHTLSRSCETCSARRAPKKKKGTRQSASLPVLPALTAASFRLLPVNLCQGYLPPFDSETPSGVLMISPWSGT